ncbi:site-specific integrase [Deinococcus rubellus]|uniref:Tyrosine-type recombinase/integrase n=1 Tax=Deinococcus rubellus TaxID=1889240 RepID=A0ABY5YKN6_9DEIO|nr:tyrosine-type recombinase/integrase [Deinococcus rubellus]UWX64824.1 tyrosine-type recombinase/integrase [Deinococcus rubellus]
MSGKRSNGEGSIYQLTDGSWRGSITVQLDGLGRPKRKSVRGKTQKEVREKLKHLLRLRDENALIDSSRMTISEFLEVWIRDTNPNLKATTAHKRGDVIRLYVAPHLGRHQLQKLTPLDIQHWQTNLLTTPRKEGAMPLNPNTVAGAMTLLNTALKHALQLGLIHRNPADAVKRVKVPRRDFQVWEPSEVQRLIVAVQDDRLYGLVYLALTTGMRRGELCGLQWADITRGVITVRHNCVLVGNTATITTPKSEKSRRRIPLPADTLEALRLHRERQHRERDAAGEDWQATDLVFASSIGTLYHPRNLLRDWYVLLEMAKVRRIRIHDLRHTYASLAIYQGLDPKSVADRLGHSRASLTLDLYAHVFEEQRERAALTLGELMNRSESTDGLQR